MEKEKSELTNIELFYLISKPYISTKEIKKVLNVGINQAIDISNDIKEKQCKDMLLPKGKIPTEYLLKIRKDLDINKIFEKAKMEKEIKGRD